MYIIPYFGHSVFNFRNASLLSDFFCSFELCSRILYSISSFAHVSKFQVDELFGFFSSSFFLFMHFDCISEASNDFSRAEVFRYFLKKVCFEKVIFISDEEQSPRKDLYFLRVHAILMLPVTLNCI